MSITQVGNGGVVRLSRKIEEQTSTDYKPVNQPVKTSLIYPVEDIYCQVDGLKIHYQVSGPLQAPPLVLIHGIGGCINWWRENVPSFSQHYRTYTLDLPGFGRSKRLSGKYTIEKATHFVRSWLELLHLKQVYLVGHSMGGQIAARLASQHPELVEKLVLAAPSGLWVSLKERLGWLKNMPKVNVPLSQSLTIAMGTMRTDSLAFSQSLLAIISDKTAEESYKRLTTPTLLLWGSSDGVLPPMLGPRTLEHIKNAPVRLVYLDKGTHNLMFDQAQEFNKLVINFLGEV